uniref:Uncharacterized protein n=1 Tax=Oryza glumipatula TaxID=40148 RepID=A0A0D9Y965_9ORYZ
MGNRYVSQRIRASHVPASVDRAQMTTLVGPEISARFLHPHMRRRRRRAAEDHGQSGAISILLARKSAAMKGASPGRRKLWRW